MLRTLGWSWLGRSLAIAGSSILLNGCVLELSDPSANGTAASNHNPSSYSWSFVPLTDGRWSIGLADAATGQQVPLQSSVSRFTSIGPSTQVTYFSGWFGDLRPGGAFRYATYTGARPAWGSEEDFRDFVISPTAKRGAVLAASEVLTVPVADAKLAGALTIKTALAGFNLEAVAKPILPALYDRDAVTHSVKIERVGFQTVTPSGKLIRTSGLLAYPTDGNSATLKKIVSYQHYTDGATSTVDSPAVRLLAQVYAGRGAVFFAADTPGIGESSGEAPSYLMWANAANVYIDGIVAANNRLIELKRIVQPIQRLHLIGYSKGGFGTVAAAEALDTLYGVAPEKVYFGAAPLDMSRTFQAYLKLKTGRDASADKFAAAMDVVTLEDYIKTEILPSWSSYSSGLIDAAALYDATGKLKSAFADAYLDPESSNSPQTGLKSFMEANSFSERSTFLSRMPLSKSKVRVYQYSRDPVIPVENTEAFLRITKAKGLPDVSRGDCREETSQFKTLLAFVKLGGSNGIHAICGFATFNDSVADL